MPRLLISVNAGWNLVNFRAGLIRALVADGHEVIAAVVDDGTRDAVAALGARFVPLAMANGGMSPFADLRLLWRYLRLFRRERPDVFLGWTIKPNVYGTLAARMSGIPSIANISGLGTAFIRQSWLTAVATRLYRLGLKRASTVFFQNEDDRDLFVASRAVRREQVVMLPGSGIDPEWSQYASDLPQDDGIFRFLLIARLIADKGVHEYIAAARRLRLTNPRIRCQILGFTNVENRTAISRETLHGWIEEGIVEHLGATDDVRPAIEQADCVVLPSYREGTSRVLLEASAMRRPVIATDVPGCRNVVADGETGFLCAPRDANSLFEAMQRMVAASPQERKAMGLAGSRYVGERFSEAAVIAKYVEAIARAVGSNPRIL